MHFNFSSSYSFYYACTFYLYVYSYICVFILEMSVCVSALSVSFCLSVLFVLALKALVLQALAPTPVFEIQMQARVRAFCNFVGCAKHLLKWAAGWQQRLLCMGVCGCLRCNRRLQASKLFVCHTGSPTMAIDSENWLVELIFKGAIVGGKRLQVHA